jgi:3-dehydroquinate synthase
LITITVEADGRKHDVAIGPLNALPAGILITDEQIWSLHSSRLPDIDPIFVPQGEAAKTWAVLERLTDELAARNAGRDTAIIALGGGSIGDVAGLTAALFKRGCRLIHVPTTLVAQVDSAIGGKVAIDAAGLKNVVGTFYLPEAVYCDPAFLATLDRRQLRAGYAELVKYGLIADPAMFGWCESHAGDLLDGDSDLLAEGVAKAVAAKARNVREDFHDTLGQRALLNFGHTFGHAVESLAGFGPVLHGEAVAIGMALAFQLSVELGLCPPGEAERVVGHLRSVGLPTTLAEAHVAGRANDLAVLMAKDKKADVQGLKLILTRGIGQAFVSGDVTPAQVSDFLERAA